MKPITYLTGVLFLFSALAIENVLMVEDELVSVAVLYRHGDRGPIGSYPGDPYHNISYWPEGYGQLVNKGKLRQFELGKWLRDRYRSFLSEQYSPKEILVQSSDVDRCLMSAASNLAGLYTPTGSSVWLEGFPWEPVPIHTAPAEQDVTLAMSRRCPKFQKLYQEVSNSEFFKNITVEYADIFKFMLEKTGWNDTDIGHFQGLYCTFYVYRMHNRSYIPSWANSLDPANFTYLAGLSFARETFTDDLKRLKAGPFFHYLTEHFDKVLNTTDFPKFLMLSGHDGTVVAALNSMGAYDFAPPEFASTVLWELRKNSTLGYYINMFYKKPSLEDLQPVVLAGCEHSCTFEDFKRILKPVTVSSEAWEKECSS